MSQILQGTKKSIFFEITKRSRIFLERILGRVLCEFSVYRQEEGETERITRFCIRTELGASHD